MKDKKNNESAKNRAKELLDSINSTYTCENCEYFLKDIDTKWCVAQKKIKLYKLEKANDCAWFLPNVDKYNSY